MQISYACANAYEGRIKSCDTPGLELWVSATWNVRNLHSPEAWVALTIVKNHRSYGSELAFLESGLG